MQPLKTRTSHNMRAIQKKRVYEVETPFQIAPAECIELAPNYRSSLETLDTWLKRRAEESKP